MQRLGQGGGLVAQWFQESMERCTAKTGQAGEHAARPAQIRRPLGRPSCINGMCYKPATGSQWFKSTLIDVLEMEESGYSTTVGMVPAARKPKLCYKVSVQYSNSSPVVLGATTGERATNSHSGNSQSYL